MMSSSNRPRKRLRYEGEALRRSVAPGDQKRCRSIPSRCFNENSCLCGVAERPCRCSRCNDFIIAGDCLRGKRNATGDWENFHGRCPTYKCEENVNAPCEKGAVGKKCKCAKAWKDFPQCNRCLQPIYKNDCIIRKAPATTHSLCPQATDSSNESPLGVDRHPTFDPSNGEESTQGLQPRSLLPSLTIAGAPSENLQVGDICTFQIEPAPKQGKYFEILELVKNQNNNSEQATMAVGKVYIPLEDTFLGKIEADRLKGSFKYALLKNTEKVLLCHLRKSPISKESLKTDLIWDPIRKRGDGACEHLLTFGFERSPKVSDGADVPSDSTKKRKVLIHRKPVFADLFAGGGGISLGFAMAGFDVKFAAEHDSWAVATLRHNLKHCKALQDSNCTVFQEDVPTMLEKSRKPATSTHDHKNPKYPRAGDVDVTHSSPPCQSHSLADPFRDLRSDSGDRRNLTLVNPLFGSNKVHCFENVMGILEEGEANNHDSEARCSREVFQEMIANLLVHDYQVRCTAVDAKDYGTPQTRRRLIILAVKEGYDLPHLPPPTHGSSSHLRPYVTVKDSIGHLEVIQPHHSSDHVVLSSDERLGDRRQNTLIASKPARTLLCGGNSVWHYSQDRPLTVHERKIIQGFPEDYMFMGPAAEACRQIGNAVPVPMAIAMANAVLDCFDIRLPQNRD